MICDRTISDVKEAQRIRTKKVQKNIPLTEEELEIMERGMITVGTLNRIEEKQSELKERLGYIGYFNTSIFNKHWNYFDIFKESDLKRIVENNVVLRKSFFVYSNSPRDAVAKYHFDEINLIEKILSDLESMIEYVKNNFRECGTFYSGEE